MTTQLPPPTCLSLMVCDCVHQCPATRKFYLMGVYDRICPPSFPAGPTSLHLYLALTGGRGPAPLELELVDLDETVTLYRAEFIATFDGPQDVLQKGLLAGPITIPSAGEYRWLLSSGGEPIAERKFWVEQGRGG